MTHPESSIYELVLNLSRTRSFPFQSWTSPELIEKVSKVFNDHHETELHRVLGPKDYVTLCRACEMANYKPANWATKMVPAIEKAPIVGIEHHKRFNHQLTLHKLGICQEQLREQVMKKAESEILCKFDPELHKVYRECNLIKKIFGCDDEKMANWTVYAAWLKTDLERFVGPAATKSYKKLLTNVVVNKDVTVPIVMKINTTTCELIEMNENTVKKDLICGPHERM